MRFIPPQEEYTLRDLANFVIEHKPQSIEMTLKEEFWYRNLLNPEAMMPSQVTFHGIPLIVIE